MESVYLVTEGSYSDYHVVAAFTNEAVAHEFAGDMLEVEEYALHDKLPERRVKFTRVLVPRQGEGDEVILEESSREQVRWLGIGSYSIGWTGEPDPITKAVTRDHDVERLARGELLHSVSLVLVEGFDKDRVERSFRDRVAQVRAVLEGAV